MSRPPTGERTDGPAPPKPRRGWFAALCVLFALWMAVLLAMYYKSVYPLRHPSPPAASPAASSPP
ncbi:MAG: hypothetical protein ABR964_09945 [Tepidisphaeraceae bacterium]